MTRNQKVLLAASVATAAVITGVIIYRRRRGLQGPVLGKGAYKPPVGQLTTKGRTTKHYKGRMPIKERVGILQDMTYKSVQDPEMRKLALQITRSCDARDDECEARAIYAWVKQNIRYTGDVGPHKLGRNGPVEGVDLFQSAARTVEFGGGDCLPAGTLLLTESFDFAPIEKLVIGSRIWGRDGWTEVKDVWFKGVLPVDAVFLNNGSIIKATDDHKVYVAVCSKHPGPTDRSGGPCSCPMSERSIERIRIAQLEPGMTLVQPDRISFGKRELNPALALLQGLYLSDGSAPNPTSIDIAGQDGCPKEEQKREVQAVCEKLGIPTTWQRKYIRVRDKALALQFQQMGTRAWNKQAASIDLSEDAAKELLRGIMADSGANTNGAGRTFTTTSRQLMLQTRVLHRMLGISCSERFITDHGGLGEHPIWRLGVRDHDRSDGKAVKLLRVKAIERAVAELPVYDISTADHYVYLPEADVTVSNCDDHSQLVCTLALNNGLPCRYRVTSPSKNRGEDYTHIYPMVGLPKHRPSKWIAADTTLPRGRMGTEAGYGKRLDFTA